MNKPLAFHVGIGGSTEKRTCGNCGWFLLWGCGDFKGDGACSCKPIVPVAFDFDFWPTRWQLNANRDATDCPCWKEAKCPQS
jgi:hypothetical protein